MEQYIPKSDLVAEIERRKHKLLDNIICESDKEWVVRTVHQLNRIILFLDTLELKEVNLEEKATQLSQEYFPDKYNIWARPNYEAQRCRSACIEMVEWLKAQKGE